MMRLTQTKSIAYIRTWEDSKKHIIDPRKVVHGELSEETIHLLSRATEICIQDRLLTDPIGKKIIRALMLPQQRLFGLEIVDFSNSQLGVSSMTALAELLSSPLHCPSSLILSRYVELLCSPISLLALGC